MTESAPIEHKSQLIAWLADGCKPADEWRIGTEHEKLGIHKETLKPLAYDGAHGIRAMLEGLTAFGWQPQYEGEHIIGLIRPDEQGGGSVTLEPGGQVELSGAPLRTLHETCREVNGHLTEVREVSERLGQAYIGIGFNPLHRLEDIPPMPKGRYAIMRHYYDLARQGRPAQSGRALEMMHLSCTVQVNLDYGSEADMVDKLRIGLALQPIATALFANSPFRHGHPSGRLSERSFAWLDTDADRTGMLPMAFESGFGFEQYVDYALDVPMYFVIRDKRYIDVGGACFRDFLNGTLAALRGEVPTMADWETHLTTLFPEARVKHFIEMRGADSGSWGRLCALPAFWVGLLYDERVRHKVLDFISDWQAEERQFLRETTPVQGLATPFRGQPLLDVARQLTLWAAQGLKARNYCDETGGDETVFLEPVQETITLGRTQAELLLDKFDREWGGDVRPIFTEMAF